MYYYNIHNIVKVASNADVLPDYFKVKKRIKPDLIIKRGNFKFNKRAYKKAGLKFYGGKDTVILEYMFYGRPIQKLMISGLKKKQTKFYYTESTDRFFGIQNILNLILEIKLLQRGCTLVHSGALSKNGKGVLISAWSEMGKSSTVFGLSKSAKYDVLGDDTVILSRDGTVYAFPIKAGIYFHSKNVENVPLTLTEKAKLRVKYVISKLPPLYLYIDPNLRIDLSKFVNVGDRAKLKRVFFLEWGKKGTTRMSKGVAVQKLITSTTQCLLGHYFPQEVFLAYCYLNEFDVHYVENNMRKVFEIGIKNAKISTLNSIKKDFYKTIDKIV